MYLRHPCVSFITTAVFIIAVGTISTAGESRRIVPTPDCQNLQEISDAIHELTQAVADHRSCKNVGTLPPQGQNANYELAFAIGELKTNFKQVSQALETAVARLDDLEQKLQNQTQVVEVTVNEVAHFDQRLQKVQTIASQAQENVHAHVKEEASSKGSCRSPFYRVGDDCLFVDHAHEMSWEEARKFCRAFRGDLAVPSDVLKLKEFLINFGGLHFWIGGTDLLVEGDWRWLNGSEVDRSVGWGGGQPDNYEKEEHCLEYHGPSDCKLNDNTCSKELHFVCQDAMYAQ